MMLRSNGTLRANVRFETWSTVCSWPRYKVKRVRSMDEVHTAPGCGGRGYAAFADEFRRVAAIPRGPDTRRRRTRGTPRRAMRAIASDPDHARPSDLASASFLRHGSRRAVFVDRDQNEF